MQLSIMKIAYLFQKHWSSRHCPPISPAEEKIIRIITDKLVSMEQRFSSAIDAVCIFNGTMDPKLQYQQGVAIIKINLNLTNIFSFLKNQFLLV